MNLSKIIAATLAVSLLPAAAFAARDLDTALAADAVDLVPTTLVDHAGKALRSNPDQQAVQFAWAIDTDKALSAAAPFVADSREFWTRISADDLAKGYRFLATAPGSMIRISPTSHVQSKAAIQIDTIQLRLDDQVLPAKAMLHAASFAQLKAAGLDFADGTVAFQIDPAVGSGRVDLRAKLAAGDYLIHVFEPNSQTRAKLSAGSDTAFTGGVQQAGLQVFDGDQALPIKRISGILTAPDGRSIDVDFKRDGNGMAAATFELPKRASDVPGLWTLNAFAAVELNGETVLRDVKTSFAVVAPIARMGDRITQRRDADGLRFSVPVKAAMGSRFELRAVLYGSTADGKQVPVAIAHSADWIDAGQGQIELRFAADLLKAAKAPFELRQVELYDQSRLAKQETRQVAAMMRKPMGAKPGL